MTVPAAGADARFTRGNRGGPGNPFARQVAVLRRTQLDALTPDRMRSLAFKLVRRAETGDMAAATLLFRYALGKLRCVTARGTINRPGQRIGKRRRWDRIQ